MTSRHTYGSPAYKAEQTRKASAEKDAQWRKQIETGEWPSDACEACANRGGCCQSYGHHLGDNCLHCGNDERNIRNPSFRGAR
jgi:hypothetical protein